MKLLLFILFLVTSIGYAQTVFINGEECVKPILDKIKKEYVDNNIKGKFHQLDTIFLVQLDYPNVGLWRRLGSYHNIYLLTWLCNNPLELEYTLKHELGHMHKVSHDTVNRNDMMYKYFNPPKSYEQLKEMDKKYYEDLNKLNPKTKQ